MTQGSSFILDNSKQLFTLQTGYIIVGNHLEYLIALLNSKFIEWSFRKYYSIELGNTGLRWLKQYIETIPIVLPILELEMKIIELINQQKYDRIDSVIYKLYGLTNEEITFIET